MTKTTKMSRSELSEKLLAGAERKMSERQAFIMRAAAEPESFAKHMSIADWLELDIRYHRLAAAYYSDDLTPLESGDDEDLLLLIGSSSLPPKDYAIYLRSLSPADRSEEKVTHAAVEGLKKAMLDTVGR